MISDAKANNFRSAVFGNIGEFNQSSSTHNDDDRHLNSQIENKIIHYHLFVKTVMLM